MTYGIYCMVTKKKEVPMEFGDLFIILIFAVLAIITNRYMNTIDIGDNRQYLDKNYWRSLSKHQRKTYSNFKNKR